MRVGEGAGDEWVVIKKPSHHSCDGSTKRVRNYSTAVVMLAAGPVAREFVPVMGRGGGGVRQLCAMVGTHGGLRLGEQQARDHIRKRFGATDAGFIAELQYLEDYVRQVQLQDPDGKSSKNAGLLTVCCARTFAHRMVLLVLGRSAGRCSEQAPCCLLMQSDRSWVVGFRVANTSIALSLSLPPSLPTSTDVGLYKIDSTPVPSIAGADPAVGSVRVDRVYFGFGPMLKTLTHCRGVVAADATFMTGEFPSTLYVIVGKDANNQLVPAAFMLAWTAEQLSDWVPFLKTFKPRMHHIHLCISVAAKGLKEAMELLGWRHSRCAKHMFNNMRNDGITRGVSVTDVCTLAKQCSAADFEYMLSVIEKKSPKVGPKAVAYLRKHQAEYSAVTFLPEHPRFGDALNNAAEAFNSILVRDVPGQQSMKNMGWLSVMIALRRRMHKWHTDRYESVRPLHESHSRDALSCLVR